MHLSRDEEKKEKRVVACTASRLPGNGFLAFSSGNLPTLWPFQDELSHMIAFDVVWVHAFNIQQKEPIGAVQVGAPLLLPGFAGKWPLGWGCCTWIRNGSGVVST